MVTKKIIPTDAEAHLQGPELPAATALRSMASFLRSHQLPRKGLISYRFGCFNEAFDAFGNEPGLPRCLARLPVAAGAVVGVSGALLDVAAIRSAPSVISIDVNPEIGQALLYLSAVLLVADASTRARGWSSERQAQEVRDRLSGKVGPVALLKELSSLRIEPWILEMLRPLCYPVQRAFCALQGDRLTWCTGAGAPERVRHLTALALSGRILAITSELSSSRAVAVANAAAHDQGVPIDHVHLSNSFEYTPRVAETCAVLAELDLAPDASLTVSARHFRRAAKVEIKASYRGTIKSLGTFDRPRAHRARAFLAKGQALEDDFWAIEGCRRHWFRFALLTMNPDLAEQAPVHETPQQLAATCESAFQVRARTRRGWVRSELERLGRWTVYRELIGPTALSALPIPLPKHPNAVMSSVYDFDRLFWTMRRKRKQLLRLLAKLGVPESVVPNLKERLAICRSWNDLVSLNAEVRAECDAAMPGWGRSARRDCFKAVLSLYSRRPVRRLTPSFWQRLDNQLKSASSLDELLLAAHDLRLEMQ